MDTQDKRDTLATPAKTDPPSIMDVAALGSDLRLAAAYAARIGVLGDGKALETLDELEQSWRSDADPSARSITLALAEVTRAIAPMTLADLRSGRDPFEPKNQRRARGLQLCLAVFALITMLMIGHSMQSLRIEKAGLKAMEQLQAMQPTQKSIALRKMAQLEDPLRNPGSTADLYRQKLGEWVAMYQTRQILDTQSDAARMTSMFPWEVNFESAKEWLVERFAAQAKAPPLAVLASLANGEAGSADNLTPLHSDAAAAAVPAPTAEFCQRDDKGAIVLSLSETKRPGWMKNVVGDLAEDFCFRDEVLRPMTGARYAYSADQDVGRGSFIPLIESRISMRSDWFLPFWFGCLGAIIFVMRNVASIRTPAMELFPMFMRISLGGVAGIVIGWFSTAALPALESTGALSVPFALAFLTGYAIDALFGVLDRMSRVAQGVSAAAGAGKA
ncbi:MAG: hypothetical protein ABI589_05790 [Burkholderiales bacterium]